MTDDQVRTFSAVSGAHYAAFAGPSEAGLLGFNNVVVPGPLLVMVHLLAAGMDAEHGDLEVWFRRPVTVGSALAVVRSDHDPTVWSIRSVATKAELTVARCSSGR